MAVAAIDKATAERFSERTLQILNDAALAMMISIGHRTGLFDTMSHLPAAPVGTIAAAAQLNERYVREWLGAMVTGGVIDHDSRAGTFKLPPEHAAILTRAATPNNVAVTTQWISVLGGAEDAVVEAFYHGRGVPYSAYHRFHEVMAEESQQTVVEGLQQHILPLVDGLADRLAKGIDVLDIACGSGRAAIAMAEAFPQSRFNGIDMSTQAIAAGRGEASKKKLRNVNLIVGDAAELPLDSGYHLITAFDAVHDQARPSRVLERVYAALCPGGVFLMQDIAGRTAIADNVSNPLAPFNYTVSCMHCMSVSLASGGPGLGAMWGREKALEMLADAGFENVRVEMLPHDPLNFYYVAVKSQGR
jgi:ubiquinone/menaquinone biosynthesis C-methylase UbiE